MKKFVSIVIIIGISFICKAQNRIVLLEQFSNSGCPPCATYTPPILDYVKNNIDKVIAITYHTAYPYLDSMYYENPIESDNRVNFYGSFGVPHSIVDGNYLVSSTGNIVNTFASSVNNRGIIMPNYGISSSKIKIQNGMISGNITFNSLSNSIQNDSLKAFIIAIENRVEKSSYAASPGKNSETFYSYVMRKFLTPSNGYSLQNKTLGTSDSISFSWNIKNYKDLNELRLIAFVQNSITKEIYQSALINPYDNVSSGINKSIKNNPISIYPNPSNGEVNLHWNEEMPYKLTVYNNTGQLVHTEMVYEQNHSIIMHNKGFYYVSIQNNEFNITEKLILK